MLPIPTSSFGPTFTFTFALTLFGLLGNLSLVRGFSFNTSTPTQCGELTVQWDGGSEPFEISLVPTISVPGGRIRNITVPRGLNQPYRYSFLLNEPAGLEFLASMSDSNGFGTGGTTGVLTVGSSDNNTCVDSFFFQTSTNSPTQCNPMSISWPNNVTAPVNLYGLIPGGTAFQLPIPQPPSTSYDWPVNIAEGTQFLLYMSDAGQAQTGGSTQLLRVGGGSTGCMNSTSPRAGGSLSGTGTASPSASGALASVSGVGGSSSGGGSNGGGGGGATKSNTGAIAGGVVGGVAFLVLLAALLFFCCRRKARERRGSSDTSVLKNYGAPPPGEKSGRLDILGGVMPRSDRRNARGRQWSDQETRVGEEGYEPSPFRYPSPPTSSQGAALLAGGAGAAAGAGTGAGVGGRKAQEAANERNLNASQQRMSGENGHPFTMGTDTGNGSGTRDSYESTRTPPRSMDHTGYGGTGTGTNSESIPRTPTSQAHGFPPTITAFPFGGNANGNGAKSQGSPLRANHPALATGHGYNDNDSTGASGRDEMSQGGRTDMATLGHDAMGGTNANGNVQRGNSTRKTGFGNVTGVGAGTGPGATGNGGVPPSPTQGFPRRGADEGLMGDSHGDHGGAGAGAGLGLGPSPGEGAVGSGLGEGPETRFVQHEDVGPVVDLPPRYDQLRARNPDIAQA